MRSAGALDSARRRRHGPFFDRNLRLCHERLEHAQALLIGGLEGLIGEHDQRILKMRVEVPLQVARVTDGNEMVTDERAQRAREDALPGSGLASELRAQVDFLPVTACEVRPEARKPVTHVYGP